MSISSIRGGHQVARSQSRPQKAAAAEPQAGQDEFVPSSGDSGIFNRAQFLKAAGRGPSEAQEKALLGGKNQPAQLVQLNQGNRPGAVVTVHGINAAPDHVDPLSKQASKSGKEVYTLAYDDRFRSLTDNSRDLAQGLDKWMQANPGEPLTIRAHSMGGRVALAALDQLDDSGKLKGRKVELDLIASPLGGYASANMARTDITGTAGALIPGVRPGKDMGTTSAFQKELESTQLPSNVRTRIFTGDQDTIVDASMPGFHKIASNLRAQWIPIAGADHDSIVARVANR